MGTGNSTNILNSQAPSASSQQRSFGNEIFSMSLETIFALALDPNGIRFTTKEGDKFALFIARQVTKPKITEVLSGVPKPESENLSACLYHIKDEKYFPAAYVDLHVNFPKKEDGETIAVCDHAIQFDSAITGSEGVYSMNQVKRVVENKGSAAFNGAYFLMEEGHLTLVKQRNGDSPNLIPFAYGVWTSPSFSGQFSGMRFFLTHLLEHHLVSDLHASRVIFHLPIDSSHESYLHHYADRVSEGKMTYAESTRLFQIDLNSYSPTGMEITRKIATLLPVDRP